MNAEEYALEHETIIRLQFNRWEMNPINIGDSDVSRLSMLADLIGGSFDEAIGYLNVVGHQSIAG